MGLFDFFKNGKKIDNNQQQDNRLNKLLENANVPFTIEIKDDRRNSEEELKYFYTDVECSIIGELDGMKTGAVLYVRKNGVLANVCSENILQINNQKIKDMVNNFFDKDSFSTLRAKYVSSNDNIALINIGFYVSYSVDEEEIDEEDED